MRLVLILRATVRRWRRAPVLTAGVAVVLALGIGLVGHTISSVNGMLLRPLPFANEARLVTMFESQPALGRTWRSVSPPNFDDWRRTSQGLVDMAAYQAHNFTLGGDDRPEHVRGCRVTPAFFRALGTAPIMGRTLADGEDLAGRDRVAVLSYVLWRRRFDGDPAVVGRLVRLDGTPHTIVGVMPERYELPEWSEIWTPLVLDLTQTPRDARTLAVLARLRPGWTLEAARDEMKAVADQLAARHPGTNRDWSVFLRPLRETLLPTAARAGIIASSVSVVLVLLLVCANIANLLLADAIGRRQEMAMRAALGATRRRLVTETLVESLALAAVGGAGGLVVASWIDELVPAIVPFEIPRWIDISLDGLGVAATAVAAMLTGVVFGLVPAVRGGAAHLTPVQRGEVESRRGYGPGWLRHGLLGFQLINALVLLTGALLLVQAALGALKADLGFDTARVLTMRMAFPPADYPDEEPRLIALERALARARSVSSVVLAGAADVLPASEAGYRSLHVEAEGQPRPAGSGPTVARVAAIGDYQRALGLTLVDGRWLREEEMRRGDASALVSQSLVRRLWPDGRAVNRRLRPAGSTADDWLTVAGVVSSTAPPYRLKGIDAWPDAQLYLPMKRVAGASHEPFLVVRTAGEPAAAASALRVAIQDELPEVPLFGLNTMREVLRRVVWLPVLWGQTFSAFALLAVVIAAVGIYSFTAYAVGVRYREFGIRMALGASPRALLRLAVGQLVAVGAASLIVGLVLARLLAAGLSSMLEDLDPSQPGVYLAVAGLLAAVLLAGAWFPARRASRADPLPLLRV